MEQHDLVLIEKYMASDKALENLYREHVTFERQIEKYNNKPYLTPSEELERKTLQKMKLKGRDMIEDILRKYRNEDSLS